jgi:hypothetical protein
MNLEGRIAMQVRDYPDNWRIIGAELAHTNAMEYRGFRRVGASKARCLRTFQIHDQTLRVAQPEDAVGNRAGRRNVHKSLARLA